MSSFRLLTLGRGVGLLAVLCLLTALYAHRRRNQVETRLIAWSQARSRLDFSIRAAQTQLGEVRAARSRMDALAASNHRKSAQATTRRDYNELINRHPELLKMYAKVIRDQLAKIYGPTFAKLKLSPDQIDRMESLLLEDHENHLDLMAADAALGISETDPASSETREQQLAALHRQEQALLGDQAYTVFSAVSRAEVVRPSVDQIANMTAFSANPLTGEQADQLVQLLAQSSGTFRDGMDASVGSVDWAAVLARAPLFLGPQQVASLQAIALNNQFQNAVKNYVSQLSP